MNMQADTKSDTAKDKSCELSTGGYDGSYGGGYSTANAAQQVRGAVQSMGDSMCKIATEDGMKLSQTKGYFNFGAGQKISCGGISVIMPTGFTYTPQIKEQIFISHSADSDILQKSPIEFWINYISLNSKMLICDFTQLHITQAYKDHLPYKELVINGDCAIMTVATNKDSVPITANIYVLCNSGMGTYSIKIIINSPFENAASIVKRIYNSITIQEK